MLILQIAAGVLIALTVYELMKEAFNAAGTNGFNKVLAIMGAIAAVIAYLIWKTW